MTLAGADDMDDPQTMQPELIAAYDALHHWQRTRQALLSGNVQK